MNVQRPLIPTVVSTLTPHEQHVQTALQLLSSYPRNSSDYDIPTGSIGPSQSWLDSLSSHQRTAVSLLAKDPIEVLLLQAEIARSL